MNSSFLNKGAVLTKYTGHGGKYGSSDASSEFLVYIRKIFVGWSLAESYNYINQHSKGNLPQNSSIVPIDKNERPITPNFIREKMINNSNQMNKALNYKIKDCKKIEERTIKINKDKIRKINMNKFKVNSFKKVKKENHLSQHNRWKCK